MAWEAWLEKHWFVVVQAFGLVASICLTAAALRRDARARKTGDYLTLAGQHRELWSEVSRNPNLARVLDPEVDLLAMPVTAAEAEFLNLTIVHFQSGWFLARRGGLITLKVLAKDANAFFALPLPKAIWVQTRHMRDPNFVSFIEKSLADPNQSWWFQFWRKVARYYSRP